MTTGRLLITAGVLLLGLTQTLAQEKIPSSGNSARATISDVAWMSGSWTSAADGTVEEQWTSAAGGAMLGMSRTLNGSRMVGFEFMRMVEREGGLAYIAQPGGRAPTEFTLTAIDGQSATFENPGHDYPTRIRYLKRADGGMDATISGAAGSKAHTFSFRRAH